MKGLRQINKWGRSARIVLQEVDVPQHDDGEGRAMRQKDTQTKQERGEIADKRTGQAFKAQMELKR